MDLKRVGMFKEMSYLGPGNATEHSTTNRPRYEMANTRRVQPYDSKAARLKGSFSGTLPRAFEGEGGDVLHGDAVFRLKDKENSSKRNRPRRCAWRPASASGTFSSYEYIPQGPESTDTDPYALRRPKKKNFVTGPTRRGNANSAHALLQKKEFEHFSDAYEQTERFRQRVEREGLRSEWVDTKHLRAGKSAFKPSNGVTGNQSFTHDGAFLATTKDFGFAREQEDKMSRIAQTEANTKFTERSKRAWYGTNTARDRYQRDFGKNPEHLPAGYELQEVEVKLSKFSTTRPKSSYVSRPPWRTESDRFPTPTERWYRPPPAF